MALKQAMIRVVAVHDLRRPEMLENLKLCQGNVLSVTTWMSRAYRCGNTFLSKSTPEGRVTIYLPSRVNKKGISPLFLKVRKF